MTFKDPQEPCLNKQNSKLSIPDKVLGYNNSIYDVVANEAFSVVVNNKFS